MIKKTKVTEISAAKKKKSKRKSSRKKVDAAKVREELAGIVKSEAKGITAAVIGQAKQGELAPAKYLLEMAGVFPCINEGEHASEEEDCLAKTLLERLNAARKPPRKNVDGERGKGTTACPEGEDGDKSVVG
jgi:hypothetical protein